MDADSSRYRVWTDAELVAILKREYAKARADGTVPSLAKSLNRTPESVHERAARLHIGALRECRPRRPATRRWSPAEDAVLRVKYICHRDAGTVQELADQFNRGLSAIWNRASKLKLTTSRSEAQKASRRRRSASRPVVTVERHVAARVPVKRPAYADPVAIAWGEGLPASLALGQPVSWIAWMLTHRINGRVACR